MARKTDAASLRRELELRMGQRDLPSKLSLDPILLAHELQIHQIELEMQNEALKELNHELEFLRAKYKSLYESAPVGYFTLSAEGDVVECNEHAYELLGLSAGVLLKKRLRDCFAPGSRPGFDLLLLELSQRGHAVANELMVLRPKSVAIYVRVQARTVDVPDEAVRTTLLVMMDISALKYAMDDIATVIQTRSV